MRGEWMVAAVAFLAFGCTEKKNPAPDRAFNPGPVPVALTSGETLFNQNCSSCHGNLAMGTDQGAPLVHIIYEPNHHSDEAFRRAVSLGVIPHHWSFGPMKPQAAVSPEQVEEIIRYVRWLQQKGGIQ